MYEMNRINNTKPIVNSSGFQDYCDVGSWNISFISCMHSKMMPTENNLWEEKSKSSYLHPNKVDKTVRVKNIWSTMFAQCNAMWALAYCILHSYNIIMHQWTCTWIKQWYMGHGLLCCVNYNRFFLLRYWSLRWRCPMLFDISCIGVSSTRCTFTIGGNGNTNNMTVTTECIY